jgi:hypothetical protein
MEEYNRDGPPQGPASWMGLFFWMVAGFLIGALPLPFAIWRIVVGDNDPPVFVLLLLTPFTALFGGLLGMGLAWKGSKRPTS